MFSQRVSHFRVRRKMKQQTLTRKLAGIVAVGFALSATGYLAFKEHKSANPKPTEPPPAPVVEPEQPQVVAQDLEAEPLLGEQGVPFDPEASSAFLFGSKSLVIPAGAFEAEDVAAPDVFLPSSKFRAIDTKTLVEPAPDTKTQPVEN